MKKLYVKFEENVVFDVLGGSITDPGGMRPGRGAKIIPFAEHISIRKLKPREKLSHKIGNRWISSRKISLAYLIACYMVKNNKSVLAGFFNRGDGKYIFMEIKIGNMTVEARYMLSIDSSPANFMAMAGRQYDGIFGDGSLMGEPDYINIPYEKLLREVTTSVNILQAAIALVVIGAIMAGGLYWAGVFTKKKVTPAVKAQVKKEIPPLSEAEIRSLSMLITHEALIKYKLYVENLPDDIALKSASFKLLPVPAPPKDQAGKQELRGTISFQFESFYPFRGSKKNREFYTFDREIAITKTRDDVKAANELEAKLRENKKGFGTLIDFCDLTFRGDKEWKFALSENEYRRTVTILNDIYLSPVVINAMTITDEKTTGEITYYKF